MTTKTLMFIIGTRPEAIKMAPVILLAKSRPEQFKVQVVITSQHRQMLDQMLELFHIEPDVDLDIMQPDQNLAQITSAALNGLYEAIQQLKPDWVLVQGDTTTSFVGALAAFYLQIPVAHIEAGLRTGKRYLPFPEEINRCMTGRLASLHFPPTQLAQQNLINEGISKQNTVITGNTAIDALYLVLQKQGLDPDKSDTDLNHPVLLVTAHRRENHGQPLQQICDAILALVQSFQNLRVVFPVHLSPRVRQVVDPSLAGHQRIELVEPMDYAAFVKAMHQATIILSDSGGVQEEAPSLGKPVLVMRSETERPEAITAGTAKLVGTDKQRLIEEVSALLSNKDLYQQIAAIKNPFGEGKASNQILDSLVASTGFEQVLQ